MKIKPTLIIAGMAALLPLTASGSLVAYWAFDGATAADRLQESLGSTAYARGRLDDMGFFDHVLLPSEIAAINVGDGTPLGDITFVPEPSAILLGALSGLALLRRRRG